MARRRKRSPLGEVVHQTRVNAGLEQAELAERIGIAQPRISDIEGTPEHLERLLDVLAAIEKAAGQERGYILRRAGYISDAVDVAQLLETDPTLDESGREHIAGLYRIMQTKRARYLQPEVAKRLTPEQVEVLEDLDDERIALIGSARKARELAEHLIAERREENGSDEKPA